ncbi:hypothetical protein [Arsenicibacter rosenii]|uniref:Uncharacterized protein n=1 Tax=Arsenicibacter rosenii TaxID=1750698 RepID=A0A1S2VSB5_9BACT|nr:hypothetical protein [Arsenicibacter rosenii]OIN61176.1 hypothetical protein BLX24_03710 [Arsenicibacter rosenii]
MKENQTTTARLRNQERFVQNTGKSEAEYQAWATEVGRRMHINNLDKLVCAKLNIYTVSHLAYLPTPTPIDLPADEYDKYLADRTENPLELAQLWLKTKPDAQSWVSVQSILADNLRPFPKSDFELHGDPNWLPDVAKSWFRKDGLNLDVQIEEISAMSGRQITLQDAIDFVRAHKPGMYKNPAQLQLEYIEERFKNITTFRIKDYYAEHLLKSCYYVVPTFDEVPF